MSLTEPNFASRLEQATEFYDARRLVFDSEYGSKEEALALAKALELAQDTAQLEALIEGIYDASDYMLRSRDQLMLIFKRADELKAEKY